MASTARSATPASEKKVKIEGCPGRFSVVTG
jgi:hypothetical protein